MQTPLQITFRNLDTSPSVEAKIRERVGELERFFNDLTSCRVMIEAPSRHHREGGLYHIRVDLKVPGREIVVKRDPSEHHAHEDIYPNVSFDFLGYGFRPRSVLNSRSGQPFCGFNPAVSTAALTAMRATIRDLGLHRRTQMSMADIAHELNPLLRGWIDYYGRFAPSALTPIFRHVNLTLRGWAMRKFKRLTRRKTRAGRFLENLSQTNPRLFVHWQFGMTGAFA